MSETEMRLESVANRVNWPVYVKRWWDFSIVHYWNRGPA